MTRSAREPDRPLYRFLSLILLSNFLKSRYPYGDSIRREEEEEEEEEAAAVVVVVVV